MGLVTERQRIQHLLRRAGFGYSAAEIQEHLALGLDGSIERLLAPELVDDSAAEAAIAAQELDTAERNQDIFREWHLRIQHTRRPLLERMTAFWHGHFACSFRKVPIRLMHLQNQTLRSHALGSFPELTLAVTRDPAMMVELDNRMNAAGKPNENYARELMELFAMGEGRGYTETDVQESARALTGWRFSKSSGVRMVPRLHDDGEKTVLGVSGRLTDQDVVEIVAARPETADFIAGKLWRHFAGEEPVPAAVERLADAYRDSGGDIRAMLRTIFEAPEFYSERVYRARVKSPVELIFGTLRALEITTSGREEMAHGRRMNQLLYDPPHPQGWTDGAAWLNSTTMLARSNFANEVTRGNGRRRRGADLGALLHRRGRGRQRRRRGRLDAGPAGGRRRGRGHARRPRPAHRRSASLRRGRGGGGRAPRGDALPRAVDAPLSGRIGRSHRQVA